MITHLKHLSFILLFSLLLGALFGPCCSTSFAAAAPKLSAKNVSLDIGKVKKVKLKNASKATWKVVSGKAKITVASKKKSMTIVGKKAGKAKIRAKVNGKLLYCTITVTEPPEPLYYPNEDGDVEDTDTSQEITTDTGSSQERPDTDTSSQDRPDTDTTSEERPATDDGATTTTSKGEEVIKYARQFIGNKYVYGGNSLTEGCDCSGFVVLIYSHFKIDLSKTRTSATLRTVGKEVKSLDNIKPGDIVCYEGHVALYAGDGLIIEAQSSKAGITCSRKVDCKKIITIRRVL